MNRITNIAIIASICLHASLFGVFNGHNKWAILPQMPKPAPLKDKQEVTLEFVDVPDSVPDTKIKKDSKVISDKSVEAKDNKPKDRVKEGKAKTKEVYKGKQIPKTSMNSRSVLPQPVQQPMPQPQIPQPQIPKMEGPQKLEQKAMPHPPEQQAQSAMPQPPQKQMPKMEYDIINIPEISESIFSSPSEGPLSFEAQSNKVGPYFKQVKRSIEKYWLSYLIFKYQNNAPQESEVAVKFKILPNGEVTGVSVVEFSGDILFRDFSVASIVNTSPFPPLPENLRKELEKEGGLDIIFTFRYR